MTQREEITPVNGAFIVLTNHLKRLEIPVISEYCINRVPYSFRRHNEEAYTPKVVSIGPLYHGKEGLQVMEQEKMRCVKHFLQYWIKPDLMGCFQIANNTVERFRRCYKEALEFTDEKLVQIILIDTIFVFIMLIKGYPEVFSTYYSDLLKNVRYELLLLENQLPFFIIEDIFNFLNEGLGTESIISKCYKFFIYDCGLFEGKQEYLETIELEIYKPDHLLDLLIKFYGPLNPNERDFRRHVHTPTITELHQAGVKLRKKSSNNLLDISFDIKNGILEIPRLVIYDCTEQVLMNLIAFEQCYRKKGGYICDYHTLMDGLINTPKDVDLLVDNEIILNMLGENGDVSTMVNKMGCGVAIDKNNFHFSVVSRDLNAFCKKPWNKYKATLRQIYFNTPWAIISVIAAVILLILTFLQTVCSFISL